MKKKIRKFVTYLMVFIMMFNIFPVTYLAVVLKDINNNDDIKNTVKETEETEKEIIGEIEEKRESNIKHFRNNDGTITAAIYEDDVHYLDSNGKYLSIDNTLINNEEKIENKANNFKVLFSKKSDDEILTLKLKNYNIKLSLENAKNVNASIKENKEEKISDKNEEKLSLKNIAGTIIYKSILENVDLEYEVKGSKIKENIILNEVYLEPIIFTLDVGKLEAKLNEDLTISIKENEKENEILKLDSLYMYDSAGSISNDIKVELKKEKNIYKIVITPDENWLKDEKRIYPVTVDPTIITDQARTAIQDCYIYSGDTYNTSKCQAQLLRVGNSKFSEVNNKPVRSVIKFNLPSLESGDQVIDARLSVYTYDYGIGGLLYPNNEVEIRVHKLLTSWTESNANYSRLGASSNWESKITDYFHVNYSTTNPIKRYDTNITRIVKDWYATGTNYGVMLKSLEGSTEMRADVYFFSSDTGTSYLTKRPVILIQYRNQTGLENYQTYTSHSIGNTNIYVNNYNGNLVATHADASTPGNRLPVSINHVYNTNDASTNIGYGYGYRLNLNQTIELDDGLLKYIDEDGTRHWFSETDGVWNDESGLNLKITASGTTKYIMEDNSGNKSTFTKNGTKFYLTEIADTNNNKITITYNTSNYNLITSVKDGANKIINLTYASNLLNKITDLDNREIKYTYTSTNLTTITYPDNSITSYTYNTNHFLTKVTDVDGTYETLTYYTKKPYRLNTLKEYSSNDSLGNSLTFTYSENTTIIKGGDGRTNNYSFNNLGQTTSITDLGKGTTPVGAYGQSYVFNTTTKNANTNKLLLESNLIKSSDNMILSINSETTSSWTAYNDPILTPGTLSIDTNEAHIGNKSFKISTTTEVDTYPLYYQGVSYEAGKTYTFSSYIKGNIEEISEENAGATLAFEYKTSDGTTKKYTKYFEITNEWERYSYTLTIPDDFDNTPKIVFGLKDAKGVVYYDCIQFEESSVMNPYNMIGNGSFTLLEKGWTRKSNLTTNDKIVTLNGAQAFKIYGETNALKNIYQTYNYNGNINDTYTLSFWGKNLGVPIRGAYDGTTSIAPIDAKQSRILLRFLDANNKILQDEILHLSADTSSWQYISQQIKAKEAYAKIRIYCTFDNNLGASYFTNISLFKDDLATTLTYDARGNLASLTDTSNQTEKATYDVKMNQLVADTNNRNRTTLYEYDYNTRNRLLKSITPTGIKTTYEYDEYGNVTNTKTYEKNMVTEIDTSKEYYIRAFGSNLYLGLNGNLDTPSVPVHLSSKDDTGKQIWSFESLLGENEYKIKSSRSTNQVLNVKDSSTANNTIIQVFNNNLSTKSQEFKVVFTPNGNIAIQTGITNYESCLSVLSGYVFVPGTQIVQYTCNINQSQKFILEEVEEPILEYIESSSEYTSDGRFQTKTIDQREKTSETTYNENTGTVSSTLDTNGNTTSYTYDNMDRVTSVTNTDTVNNYTYLQNKLSSINHNGFNYNFIYDEFNNISEIKVGNQSLVNNVYAANNGNLITSTYGNGHEISYTYDKFDRITEKINNLGTVNYTYNNFNNIARINDNINNIEKNYFYDNSNRLMKYEESNGYKINYTYDQYSSLIKTKYSLNNINKTNNYTYDIDNKLMVLNDISYTYDNFDRLNTKTINSNYQIKYNYLNLNNLKTTNLIESIENGTNKLSYTYDNNGNIETIKEGITETNRYYYDNLNQLIKEDNLTLNKTIVYNYDNGGNLTSKEYYEYQTTNLVDIIDYSYTNNDWKDQLTSYDGKSITYDEIGNPLTYDGNTFTWVNGRELSKIEKGTNTYQYKYNEDGIRIEKDINGVIHKYYLEGTNIIFEEIEDEIIYYNYDESGISGIEYQGNQYYFIKNIQGDIIGILDGELNQIVTYEYDSWGKVVSIKDDQGNTITDQDHIGNINPFRYRGYYYDTETELYYLNSRYYNPEWGRFINVDSLLIQEGTLLGNNLYAYAVNNPVNNVDPSGHFFAELTLLARVVVAVIGGIIAYTVSKQVIQTVVDLPAPNINFPVNNSKSKSNTNNKTNTKTSTKTNNKTKTSGSSVSELKYPGDNPAQCPGDGFEWRGTGKVGSSEGSWYNPNTKTSMRPDLNHSEPIGKHWDVKNPNGEYRLFPDGTIEPKYGG